jgi:predicted TPR repeat methyltransferase
MSQEPRALEIDERQEMSIGDALRLAVSLHQRGERAAARTLYQRVLELAPDSPDAMHFLGLLEFNEGHHERALTLIRQALALAPDYIDAHINLGNLLKESGRAEEAEACFRRALELAPDNAAALNNLGMTVAELGRLEDAESCCRQAIERVPDAAAYRTNLGHILRRRGQLPQALEQYWQALLIDPEHAGNKELLARALCLLGRNEEAARLLEDCLRQNPNNAVARHHLAACRNEGVPARASDAYVQQVFDGFAGSFEAKLRQLDYRAPELVAVLLERALGTASDQCDILDAGCGTGLCAPLLAPYARRLDGVDLSPKMLERARERGLYDQLVVAELTAYLAARRSAWEVIAAADVLCYFGDLAAVAQAAAASLRAGGWLIFTVERAADTPGAALPGYRLQPHGRYCHALEYVHEVLAAAGLEVVECEAQVLRMENGAPVEGLAVLARKPTSA